MTFAKDNISIYFNDTLIATTSSAISYEREYKEQKEYHFTNNISGLSAIVFSEYLNIFPNENIEVEVL